jgi:hypothetical protein
MTVLVKRDPSQEKSAITVGRKRHISYYSYGAGTIWTSHDLKIGYEDNQDLSMDPVLTWALNRTVDLDRTTISGSLKTLGCLSGG